LHGATAVEYQAPDEWPLDQQLRDYAATLEIPARCMDSGRLLTAPSLRNEFPSLRHHG